MGLEEDAVEALVPPGISPELRWKIAMSLSIVTLFIYVFWSVGTFSFLGLEGFARAGDINELKTNQRASTRVTLQNEICRLYWVRMKVTGDTWAIVNKNFNDRQEEYAKVNDGQHYNAAAECSEPK